MRMQYLDLDVSVQTALRRKEGLKDSKYVPVSFIYVEKNSKVSILLCNLHYLYSKARIM